MAEYDDLRINNEEVAENIGDIKTRLNNVISEIEGVTATVDKFAEDNAGILGEAFLEGYQPTKTNLDESCDKVQNLIDVTEAGNNDLGDTGQSVANSLSSMQP